MAAIRAVRIGGKNAPRIAITKKKVEVSKEQKVKNAVAAGGYGLQAMKDVDSCAFVNANKEVTNYAQPEVHSISYRDSQPIGYIIKGDMQLLGTHRAGAQREISEEQEKISRMLQGLDITQKDIDKIANSAGSKEDALKNIIELVKKQSKTKGEEPEIKELLEMMQEQEEDSKRE